MTLHNTCSYHLWSIYRFCSCEIELSLKPKITIELLFKLIFWWRLFLVVLRILYEFVLENQKRYWPVEAYSQKDVVRDVRKRWNVWLILFLILFILQIFAFLICILWWVSLNVANNFLDNMKFYFKNVMISISDYIQIILPCEYFHRFNRIMLLNL